MFNGTALAHWLTLHGAITVVAVLVYVITAHVRHQRRHPTAAIAWVLFMLLAPYVALPSFLMFGSRKLARPRSPTALAGPSAFDDTRNPGSWAEQTARALGQPPPMGYAALQVHADGSAALTALWQTLDGARVSIDVCSFIVGRDAIGRAVIDRLAARARAGVRVRLMVDGLGHLMGGSPDFAPLRAAGAQVTLFVPPLRSPLKGRSNLRDHRKMLIADAAQANARLWCGGRNLAAEYFEGATGNETWHDLSFDLQGALVGQAHRLFDHDWAFANRHRTTQDETVVIDAGTAPGGLQTANASAQIIASGPDQVDDTVYSLLITAAYRARRNIALATPYFVPDAALLQALCMAARRGVVVDLLLPARSNHRLSDIARNRALRTLAAAGGRIWLAPQMMHAKLVVIDRELALAGSANLDSRSLFINYELMVAFHDRAAVDGFAAWFDNERRAAAPCMPRQPGLLRDVGEGLVLWVGFQL